MANHGQHPQDTSAHKRGGGGQTIVEMCEVTDSGITFWSRHRFQIGSELQMRMRRDVLTAASQAKFQVQGAWVMMQGFVVQCAPVRRAGGTVMFRVAMLFDTALSCPGKRKVCHGCFAAPVIEGCRPFGLN